MIEGVKVTYLTIDNYCFKNIQRKLGNRIKMDKIYIYTKAKWGVI
jgi:hypothetical protein